MGGREIDEKARLRGGGNPCRGADCLGVFSCPSSVASTLMILHDGRPSYRGNFWPGFSRDFSRVPFLGSFKFTGLTFTSDSPIQANDGGGGFDPFGGAGRPGRASRHLFGEVVTRVTRLFDTALPYGSGAWYGTCRCALGKAYFLHSVALHWLNAPLTLGDVP
jgi:hypothetical protein